MQALNKKLSVSYESLASNLRLSIETLTFSTLMAAILNVYTGLADPYAVIVSVTVFTVSIILFRLSRPLMTAIVILLAAVVHGTTGVYAALTAVSAVVLFYAVKNRFKESLALLGLAILSHAGDAVTSYAGFLRGFSESNPFADFFVQEIGSHAIFGVKLAVVPLTAYIYLRTESRERELFLKAVYCIGLYLTLRNMLIVF